MKLQEKNIKKKTLRENQNNSKYFNNKKVRHDRHLDFSNRLFQHN